MRRIQVPSAGSGRGALLALGRARERGRRRGRRGRRRGRGGWPRRGAARSRALRGHSPARLQVRGRGRHDPALQAGRRLDHRRASARTATTDPSSAISTCGSAQDARCARTASASASSSAPSTNEAASSRTSSQLRSGRVGRRHVGHRASPPAPGMPLGTPRSSSPASSSTRRIASSPSRIRLLTVPSGVAVRSATSTWVRPAEVGELDRLALDVGQGGHRAHERYRHRAATRPRPTRRAARSSGGGTASRSGSSDVGRRRRTASMAR